MPSTPPYRRHLDSGADLETTYEATRAGFVALALEKNQRANRFIDDARSLQEAASHARSPADLLSIEGIESGLLAAAGLSDKAIAYLQPEDKINAVRELIQKFLEPAGPKFVEELVFRFLLTRGDALGGSMRNVGGAWAQRKLTRAILATLRIAGIKYHWRKTKRGDWSDDEDEIDPDPSVRGLYWRNGHRHRVLIYNLTVPLVKNNVDLCLFDATPGTLDEKNPKRYIALGELKGGIDPAGADEHWKTAKTALERIRKSFARAHHNPYTFFIGAAIERKMAAEIWDELQQGVLSNAANLTDDTQMASISRWLCNL